MLKDIKEIEKMLVKIGSIGSDRDFSKYYVHMKSDSDWKLIDHIFKRNMMVLDIGSGIPFDAYRFAAKGAKFVVATDSEASVFFDKQAKTLKNMLNDLNKRIYFIQCDALHLPIRNNLFDMAVSFSSIEHLRNGKAANQWIREMIRVVREGKYIVITTCNRLSLLNALLSYIYRRNSETSFFPWRLKRILHNFPVVISSYVTDGNIYHYGTKGGYPLPFMPEKISFVLHKILYKFHHNVFFRHIGFRMGYLAQKLNVSKNNTVKSLANTGERD